MKQDLISRLLKRLVIAGAGALFLSFSAVPPVEAATTIVGWAIVNPNGTLAFKKNVTANFRLDEGTYRIVFNRRVDRCTYATNLRGPFTGTIVATPDPDARNAIVVYTDGTGTLSGPLDNGFDLQVICG